jgi:hypothetical protein
MAAARIRDAVGSRRAWPAARILIDVAVLANAGIPRRGAPRVTDPLLAVRDWAVSSGRGW